MGKMAKTPLFQISGYFASSIQREPRHRCAPPRCAAGGMETPRSRTTPDTHGNNFECHLIRCGNQSPSGSQEICLLQWVHGLGPESAVPVDRAPAKALQQTALCRAGITLPRVCVTERFQPNFGMPALTTPPALRRPLPERQLCFRSAAWRNAGAFQPAVTFTANPNVNHCQHARKPA